MNIRVIAAVFAGFTLCGCSYWNDTMDYVGLGGSGQEEQPASVPADQSAQTQASTQTSTAASSYAPSGQASRQEDWCRQIARAAGEEAAGEGFDAATQQRRADTAYQQCSAPSGAH
jgi:hypothetical protein